MKKTKDLFGAGLSFGLILVLQSGCASTGVLPQPAIKPETVTQSVAKPVALPDSDMLSLSGKVVETFNAGNYTYMNIEKDGQKTWAAIPYTKISVGQEVVVRSGMKMGQFTSKSLNRTFDNIIFSVGLVTDAKEELPSGHPPMDGKVQVDKGQPTPAPDIKAPLSGKVIETMDSGGYTYVNLENSGKKVWAAVPITKVSVGQELTLQPGQEMTNFNSKSLNRTFESVIFSGGVIPTAK